MNKNTRISAPSVFADYLKPAPAHCFCGKSAKKWLYRRFFRIFIQIFFENQKKSEYYMLRSG